MRPVPLDVEECREFGRAPELVQILYRELRGRTIPFWPHETAADAVQRAAHQRNIRRPLAEILTRLELAREHALAVVTLHADGGGEVMFPALPPSVVTLRAERKAARMRARVERASTTTAGRGRNGGLSAADRKAKSRAPDAWAEVPPGTSGRPRKTRDEKPVTDETEGSNVTGFVTGISSAEPPRASADAAPPRRLLSEETASEGGGKPAEKPVTSPEAPTGTPAETPHEKPVTSPGGASEKPPRRFCTARELAALSVAAAGDTVFEVFSAASLAFTPTGGRKVVAPVLGTLLQAGGYSEHDGRVIGWHWMHDPQGARARIATARGEVFLARITTEHLTAETWADEHATAQRWWHGLDASERTRIERTGKPPRAGPGPARAELPPAAGTATG